MKNFTIRKMEKADCQRVVAIHLAAFQGFFLSFLGENFLTVFYQALLAEPSGIALIYESGEPIKGFVVGTDQPSGFYRNLIKKHWFEFARASLGAFIKKPAILPRLLRAFSMTSQELPEPDCATLMSIAVDPKYQGQQVGKQLVNAFFKEASCRKVKYVSLTTDALKNDATNRFYQSLGFWLHRVYKTPENREMNEYLIYLGELSF